MFRALYALASLQIVVGTFLPISIHYEGASLEARDEQKRDCFRPTQSVDLHYIEGKHFLFATHCPTQAYIYILLQYTFGILTVVLEYHSRESYIISVTTSHSEPIYVLTEKFEHFLTDVSCMTNDENDSVHIVYAFDTADSMRMAEGSWVQSGLLFVTHHASCNSAYERAVYKYVEPVPSEAIINGSIEHSNIG